MNLDYMTRRDLLKRASVLGGTAMMAHAVPSSVAEAFPVMQQAAGAADALTQMRREMAAAPIETTRVTNLITMFSGPGGNVLVRHGEEGKVVVDTFVQGAFSKLKQRIDALGDTPLLFLINTHWHFDHTDNNESFRKAGVEIIAHQNTTRRLSESHDLLGMHFTPAPAAAMPTRVFAQNDSVEFKDLPGVEELIDLEYLPPAHTDTDIRIRFAMGDVLHLGDTFFNGMYPLIDAGTGGSMNGMISAAERAIKVSNRGTQIVPGHGPLADRQALMQYRDMLATVRDRVQKLKTAGRTESEVVAAKPTADLDATWGKGLLQPDAFVAIVYNTL